MTMCMESLLVSALSVLLGVCMHLRFWIRGEWDAYSGQIILGSLLFHITLSIILAYYLDLNLSAAQLVTLSLELSHLAGTFTSIVVYRIFFHRLRQFPGPFGAKIWVWDIFFRTWRSGNRQSVVLDALHKRYGPVVRYAPDRLSINSAAAVSPIHGSGSSSRCTKSVVYLNPVNGGSINADRDVTSHHARRKTWERALATRVLPAYIPPLVNLTSALVSSLDSTRTLPTLVNKHVQLFTFDIVGLIGFGREGGFNGLQTGVLNPAIQKLIDMMDIGVYMMLVPWLHVLLDYMPTMGIIYKPDELFREFAKATLGQYCQAQDRQPKMDEEALGMSKSDLSRAPPAYHFKHILGQIHPNPSLDDRRTLSDCVLMSIAGADTTTSTLVHTTYRLARHKDFQARAYREIMAANPPVKDMRSGWEARYASWIESAKLPFLEAFIREVLRLHPPAPTGLPRLTPPEGLTIVNEDGDKLFVPGGTNVSIPVYTLLRDPRNFVRPLDLVPERFLPSSHPEAQPELVLDGRAYIPFLQGPYGCPGKHFAYMEIKIVLATLLSVFEITLPENIDLARLHERMENEWRDYSTVKAAEIEVRFLQRSEVQSS